MTKKLLFFSIFLAGFLFVSRASATTETFKFTGATSSWAVPAGVTELTITAVGGRGGSAGGGLVSDISGTDTNNPPASV